jgi:hypothetical protein
VVAPVVIVVLMDLVAVKLALVPSPSTSQIPVTRKSVLLDELTL